MSLIKEIVLIFIMKTVLFLVKEEREEYYKMI